MGEREKWESAERRSVKEPEMNEWCPDLPAAPYSSLFLSLSLFLLLSLSLSLSFSLSLSLSVSLALSLSLFLLLSLSPFQTGGLKNVKHDWKYTSVVCSMGANNCGTHVLDGTPPIF